MAPFTRGRARPTLAEKDELLSPFDHDVGDVLHVVQVNAYWRLVGELEKLGFKIGASTIRKILREAGIWPGPDPAAKVANVPRSRFIHADLESIVATDLFTKLVYALRGTLTAYVLVFIHLGSRRTLSQSGHLPSERPMGGSAVRNAAMWLDENGIQPPFLLQDRDAKFAESVKDFWRSAGVRPLRTPVQAPKANAFVESFIGTLKRECLNYFLCFRRGQLDYILRTWIAHYNTERPHCGAGIGNSALNKNFVPMRQGSIRCRGKLGRLIKSYHCEAASDTSKEGLHGIERRGRSASIEDQIGRAHV